MTRKPSVNRLVRNFSRVYQQEQQIKQIKRKAKQTESATRDKAVILVDQE